MITAQNDAQIAERSKLLTSFLSATLDMFMPIVKSATQGALENGQLKIENVSENLESYGLKKIQSVAEKSTEMRTTNVDTEFLLKMLGNYSKSNLSGVKFAVRNFRKKVWSLTIATALTMCGVSYATSATFGLPLSKETDSCKKHWHTSKVIEVSHKQAYGNTTCTGYDKIEITPKELLNSAVFNWSRVVSMFSLTGTELMYTRGEEEVIDLMETYLDAAEKSVKEEFEVALIGDGTGAGGRELIGLGGAIPVIPNTGVYGGIDRATVPNWRTSTFNITNGDVSGFTTWDSTTARPIIERIALNRSRNGRYADLLIADSLSYQAISASFVAHQRIVSERLGRLGFAGLTYMTPAGPVDIVAAGGIGTVMPANTIFGIDTQGLAIYEFPDQAFVPFHPGDGMRPINQDAVAQGIVWSGQLVLENPLFSYRIITA